MTHSTNNLTDYNGVDPIVEWHSGSYNSKPDKIDLVVDYDMGTTVIN